MLQGLHKWNAVITDASCFILLDKISALQLLPALSLSVITTPEIAKEFGKPLPEWVEIKSATNKALQQTFEDEVDIGEASAIALAVEISASILIIDDLRGRKLAKQLQLKHTGTLGILLLAKRQGIIPLLKPLIEKIQATNFRISDGLVKDILVAAGE